MNVPGGQRSGAAAVPRSAAQPHRRKVDSLRCGRIDRPLEITRATGVVSPRAEDIAGVAGVVRLRVGPGLPTSRSGPPIPATARLRIDSRETTMSTAHARRRCAAPWHGIAVRTGTRALKEAPVVDRNGYRLGVGDPAELAVVLRIRVGSRLEIVDRSDVARCVVNGQAADLRVAGGERGKAFSSHHPHHCVGGLARRTVTDVAHGEGARLVAAATDTPLSPPATSRRRWRRPAP